MTIGQVAYNAYREHSKGRSLATNMPIPEWAAMHDDIKEAWGISAQAVIDYWFDGETNDV